MKYQMCSGTDGKGTRLYALFDRHGDSVLYGSGRHAVTLEKVENYLTNVAARVAKRRLEMAAMSKGKPAKKLGNTFNAPMFGREK